MNGCWCFFNECGYSLQNSVKLHIYCCHWFHQRQKKKRVCFLNTLYDRVEAQAQWIYFCITELCIMIHLFVARIILRHCEKLISFEMEYKKDFQISILNHHPWSHLKLNYEPNSTLIFIISILTFFSEVQFSALFLVLFILLTQLLWLNISGFIWLNVKLNTAFTTVVCTVTV